MKLKIISLILAASLLTPCVLYSAETAGDSDAAFVAGHKDYESKKFNEALEHFKNIPETYSLYDYALYLRGGSYLNLKRYGEARKTFYELKTKFKDSVWYWEGMNGEAEALLGIKMFVEYRKVMEDVAEEAGNREDEAGAFLKIAESHAFQGKWRKGIGELKKIWIDFPETEASENAVQLAGEWREHIGGEDLFSDPQVLRKRAEILTTEGYPEEALQEWLLIRGVDPEILAEAYFGAKRYEDAIRYYLKLSPSLAKDYEKVLARLATSYARLSDNQKAIETNFKLMELYPKSVWSKHAHRKLIFLYQDSMQFEKAAELAKKLLNEEQNRSEKDYLKKKLVWNLYRLGKYEDAAKEIQNGGARSLYWKIKIAKKAGKNDPAAEEELSRRYPWDYYSMLIFKEKSSSDREFFSKISSWDGKKDSPPETDVKQDSICSPASPNLFHVCHAAILDRLGLAEYVDKELTAVRRGAKIEDQNVLAYVGQLAQKIHAYRTLYWASWFFDTRNWSYIRAYEENVTKWARKYGIDRNIIYAVMRQESKFNSKVVSPVGAVGLMQIIPSTGLKLAGELKMSDFGIRDLYDPDVSIRLAAYYLSKLSYRYGGKIPLVLAAYNAGEEAVDNWLKNRLKMDTWEFVEEIPYEETYDYVCHVMSNYWIYNFLYSFRAKRSVIPAI